MGDTLSTIGPTMTLTATPTTYFQTGRSKRRPHLLFDGCRLIHPTCVGILTGGEDLDSADSGYLWQWWKAFGKEMVGEHPELMRRRPRPINLNHTDPDIRAIYKVWAEHCITEPLACWCSTGSAVAEQAVA